MHNCCFSSLFCKNGKCQVKIVFVLCHHTSPLLVFPFSASLSVQLSTFQKALVALPTAAATALPCLPFASSILPPGMQPEELGNGWPCSPKEEYLSVNPQEHWLKEQKETGTSWLYQPASAPPVVKSQPFSSVHVAEVSSELCGTDDLIRVVCYAGSV